MQILCTAIILNRWQFNGRTHLATWSCGGLEHETKEGLEDPCYCIYLCCKTNVAQIQWTAMIVFHRWLFSGWVDGHSRSRGDPISSLACKIVSTCPTPLVPPAKLDTSFALSNCKILTSLLNLVSLRIYLSLLPKEAMKGDFSCSGKLFGEAGPTSDIKCLLPDFITVSVFCLERRNQGKP